MKKNIGQKLAGEALDKVWRDVYNQEKDLEKKKVLKRNAYGYRDIAYLKLRLFNLHNDKITRFVGWTRKSRYHHTICWRYRPNTSKILLMSLQMGCYTITIKKLYYSKFPCVAQLFVFHIVCYNRFVLTNLMEISETAKECAVSFAFNTCK